MNTNALQWFASIFLFFVSHSVMAEKDRLDYDLDDDGLIEINDLDDMYAMRIANGFYPSFALYGQSEGCPNTGCIGYELTQDLNFGGRSWSGLSKWNMTFEGNGYTLYDLRIPHSHPAGLFSELGNSELRNLNITGENAYVFGDSQVGGLVGNAQKSIIHNCSVKVEIRGTELVGGLVGYASETTITNSHFLGAIVVNSPDHHIGDTGGLVGAAYNSHIIASSMQGNLPVSNKTRIGALLGYAYEPDLGSDDFTTITSSFAVVDFNRNNEIGLLAANPSGPWLRIEGSYSVMRFADGAEPEATLIHSYTGGDEGYKDVIKLTEDELKCPTESNNTDCSAYTLFIGWDSYLDSNGDPVWLFGGKTDLPSIKVLSVPVDAEGDGAAGSLSLRTLVLGLIVVLGFMLMKKHLRVVM